MIDTMAMQENEGRARRIAVMSALTIGTPGAFMECCRPAYGYMAAIAGHVREPLFVVGALLLFIRLDESVRRVTANAQGIKCACS